MPRPSPATTRARPSAVFRPVRSGRHGQRAEASSFVAAAGVVVRTIAPLVEDKLSDPAVVLLDEGGAHAVSLLSGHVGGANGLAREIARLAGGEAVITTASDVNGLPAIDLWAEGERLAVEDRKRLQTTGMRLLEQGTLRVFSDVPLGCRRHSLR